MKPKRWHILLICLISFLPALAGCWNYREVEGLAIVLGAAVDYDRDEDVIILTVEVASAVGPGPEAEIESEFIEARGRTFMGASRNVLALSGLPLFWSHAKVVVLSEELVNNKRKLMGVTDFFTRYYEPKDDAFLLLSREESARELLVNINTKLQGIHAVYLSEMMFNEDRSSRYLSMPIYSFKNDWQRIGIEPVIPGVRLRPGKDATLAEIYGTGVYKDDRLVGWLDGNETEGFLFVTNRIKGGVFSGVVVEDGTEELDISFKIISSRTRLIPRSHGGQLSMEIYVDTVLTILELGDGVLDIDIDLKNHLENVIAPVLQKQIEDVIKKVQKEYQSDIFGFGLAVEMKYPALWREIRDDWDHIFPDLRTVTNVNLEIRRSGLI